MIQLYINLKNSINWHLINKKSRRLFIHYYEPIVKIS